MSYLEKYDYTPDEEMISSGIQSIVQNLGSMETPEVLKTCFSLMDLTTLHPNDTVASVKKLVSKVNGLGMEFPSYPLPASVCVFPNFVSTVRDTRESAELHVTSVAGCFPASQSFLEVKVKECELSVENGADEVDIVLALNAFLAGDYETVADEISEIKEVCGSHKLKVILETGCLKTASNIKRASILAMYAGADYIKTSTGKLEPAATPEAAYVMCQAIKEYYDETGIQIGFKPAGGMKTVEDALTYYTIVKEVLGERWLNNQMLRLGTSSLANKLLTDITGKEVKFF